MYWSMNEWARYLRLKDDKNLDRQKVKIFKTSGFEGSEGLDGSEGSVGPDGQMVRKAQIAQCQGYLGRVEVCWRSIPSRDCPNSLGWFRMVRWFRLVRFRQKLEEPEELDELEKREGL